MLKLISTVILVASLSAHAAIDGGITPPTTKSAIEQTCPHCEGVAHDVLMLQSLKCPEGEQPSLVMDFTQSQALFVTLLTLKNSVSDSQYQKRLNQLKNNATCTKESTLGTLKEKAASLLDSLNQQAQTYLK